MSIAIVYGEHLGEKPITEQTAKYLNRIDDIPAYIEVPSTFYLAFFAEEQQIEFWRRYGHYIFKDFPAITSSEQYSKWFKKKAVEQEKLFKEKYQRLLMGENVKLASILQLLV